LLKWNRINFKNYRFFKQCF